MAVRIGASDPFPKPPEYAEIYTSVAVSNGLVFEPPPIPTEYEVFGEMYNSTEELIAPLQTMDIQLFETSDLTWREELKKMISSVWANFLDLVEILIKSVDNPERLAKIESIRLLFINMHYLVNTYRPKQARSTLEAIQKRQLNEKLNLADQIRTVMLRVDEDICEMMTSVPGMPNVPKMDDPEQSKPEDLVRRSYKSEQKLLDVEMHFAKLMDSLMTQRADAPVIVSKKTSLYPRDDYVLLEFMS